MGKLDNDLYDYLLTSVDLSKPKRIRMDALKEYARDHPQRKQIAAWIANSLGEKTDHFALAADAFNFAKENSERCSAAHLKACDNLEKLEARQSIQKVNNDCSSAGDMPGDIA